MIKKRVQSSHLALRFYKHDGWTKEILDQYLIRGRVVDIYPGQKQRDYWWLDHEQGSALDMDRLYKNEVGEVSRYRDMAALGKSDLEYMKGFNW